MTTTTAPTIQTKPTNWDRIAGIGAITFAVLVAATNIAVPSTPAWDASGTEVANWVHDHHLVLGLTVAPFAITSVALMLFAAGLMRRARQSGDGDTSVLATVGLLGMVMLAALFGVVEVARLTLLALDGSAGGAPGLFEFAWHIEGAAFVLNAVAIGIALFGVAGATVRMGLAPSWYKPLSIAGLVCGVAAALQAPAVVNGANGWQIGFVTFLSWLLLLLIVGTRMARQP